MLSMTYVEHSREKRQKWERFDLRTEKFNEQFPIEVGMIAEEIYKQS